MSSDIRGLVDRTFREYLEPMDSLESYTYLTTGIGTTETTISYDGDLLSIEEEDALDAGAIIEIGTELMYSKGLNAVFTTKLTNVCTSKTYKSCSVEAFE